MAVPLSLIVGYISRSMPSPIDELKDLLRRTSQVERSLSQVDRSSDISQALTRPVEGCHEHEVRCHELGVIKNLPTRLQAQPIPW